jgi:spore germination cell wall hydrolase CwlJ-like protein
MIMVPPLARPTEEPKRVTIDAAASLSASATRIGAEPTPAVVGKGAADAVPAVSGHAMATADAPRPKTPAERLHLSGKSRAKAEKCLANAVYFEARSEPVRGQIAVAQVVLNRAFSGFYPEDVCGVVYQNAHRRLACQFTFACDGIPDVVRQPHEYSVAKRIASDILDGKLWLPDVGKATHYHAYYVHPYWVRAMRKMRRIGAHTFYRPRMWGDGSDAPSWGTAAQTAETLSKL